MTVAVSEHPDPRVDSDSRVSATSVPRASEYPKLERSEGVLTLTGQSCQRGSTGALGRGAATHLPPHATPTRCSAASVGARAVRKSARGLRGKWGEERLPSAPGPLLPRGSVPRGTGRAEGWPQTESALPAPRGWRAAARLGGLEPRCPRTGLGGRNHHPSW